MCTSGGSPPSGDGCDDKPGAGKKCKKVKLVSITVVANATQPDSGARPKDWEAQVAGDNEVIVEATTEPNDEDTWKQVSWSGDSGKAVPDHPNQRMLRRDELKRLHIKASLGGVKDDLFVQITATLVSITVVQNATDTNVTPAKNWACVKKATDPVIVEATTEPNIPEAWKLISWAGDSGDPVPGHPEQRKLSRSKSKKLKIKASLGGVKDDLTVWVLWVKVTVLTSGKAPANAVQFAGAYDGTEKLGAVAFNGGKEARGKIVPVGKISPAGVHDVVQSGWDFKRERWTHDWDDGVKSKEGNGVDDYWNTTFVDDTSHPGFKMTTPDDEDKIYDRDAPNIAGFGVNNSETYNNFRQWVTWNQDAVEEVCSEKAGWYFRGRWKAGADPEIRLKEVGTGSKTLPADPKYPP